MSHSSTRIFVLPSPGRRIAFGLAVFAASLSLHAADVADGETTKLDDLIVTATRSAHPMRTAPATTSLISAEDLAFATSDDLLTSLRDISGLNLVGRGVGGRKVLLLRGMESRHSLILVDGRRISSTDDIVGHSNFQYDWVPAQAVERIEVVRGPMSALYGSEAMGGVVNIITRPVPSRWGGSADLIAGAREDGRGGGSFGSSVSVAGPLGDQWGVRLSTHARRTEDTPYAASAVESELEGQELYGVNAVVSWQPSANQRLELTVDRVDEDRWRDTVTTAKLPYRSTYDVRRQQLGLRWLPKFGEWTGTLNAYESRSDFVNKNTNGVAPATAQFLNDRVADATASRPLGENHTLTLGGEWRRESLVHPSFTGGRDTAVHKAAFVQDEWCLTEPLRLVAALRGDEHEYFGSQVSPRAYVVWEATKQLVFKGGYGSGFRAPTLKQSSPEYKFVGPHTFVGNADVQPESSDSYEFSVRYEPTGSVGLTVAAFHNDVDDLISTKVIGKATRGNIYQYVNLERARIRGVETELDWTPHQRLRLAASYTWLDADDLSSNLHLPSRPDDRITASLRFDAIPQRLQLMLGLEYNGEQWVRETVGESRMPAYSLLNAGLRWQVTGSHELVLSLSNLADTDLTEKSPDLGYAEPGRSATLRWRYQF